MVKNDPMSSKEQPHSGAKRASCETKR